MFNYFKQNNLSTECQSGFIPGYSCVAQLLWIAHEIYQSFDCSPTRDAKEALLDIWKTFDKVLAEDLLFKLQSYEIEGSLLRLLKNYLTARQQIVVLNGQTSSWLNVTTHSPQGSVLGLLLFLIYIKSYLIKKRHHIKYMQKTLAFLENPEQKLP